MFTPAVDVALTDISHTFNHRQAPVRALENISLTVTAGEFVSVVGPSGCGKSTLLRLVAGLIDPTAGRVLLAGQPPAALRGRKGIGWMDQRAALLPWATVLQNVQLPLRVNRRHNPAQHLSPEALLSLVGLADFAGAYPDALSGGMRQRVALARTLATRPALWLMDEPFAALDELTREALGAELLALWRQFKPTVLWVTHHLAEAVRLSDRVVLLSARPGHICGQLSVPLPRPRDDTGPQFQALVRQARLLLQPQKVGHQE